MNFDEHDDLWRVLGKAREPQVSPFFARNVLRAIRETRPEDPALFRWLIRWRKTSTVLAAAALVTLSVWSGKLGPQGGNLSSLAVDQIDEAAAEVAASPEFMVIENLDTLLAWEANEAWLDDSSSIY